jgi:hypothetical protein
MEQITTKTPIPRCWLFLKNWPVNGPCGRCSSVCGPLGWSTNFEGSESDQIQCTLTKSQVSKRPVSKRLKRQVCKTLGLQNVRSSKRPVAKKHQYIFCTCGWWKSAGSVASMFAGKVMAVFYSLFWRVVLPLSLVKSKNDTLFSLNRNVNLAIPTLFV